MATRAIDIPAHVDPAIVRHCALFDRRPTYDNPYETVIAEIHRGPAVFFADNISVNQPGWVVRRGVDIRRLYADTENFTKRGNTGFAALIGEDWDMIPTELDPPVHHGFRSQLAPIYSPSRMMSLQGSIGHRANEIIDRFRTRGECEFVRDFAVTFPVSIFLDLIGLPQDRLHELVKWVKDLIHGDQHDLRVASVFAIKELLIETVAERRRNPGDDLISQAMTLEVDGRKWTDREVFGHAFNLYIGGLDTVTSNLGLHFWHLATHPEDQETMRRNDYNANVVAIEELLRAYAAVSNYRICAKRYELDGQVMMPGDYLVVSSPLAARDPELYDNPHEIRLDRRPSHVALGNGVHRCLGQHLARRELQTAIEEFFRAIPTFTVEPGFKVPFFLSGVIHIDELPLRWG
jgi:cytochrome P450